MLSVSSGINKIYFVDVTFNSNDTVIILIDHHNSLSV